MTHSDSLGTPEYYEKQRRAFYADPADEAIAGPIYDAFPRFPFLNQVNRKKCVHLIADALRAEREGCARIADMWDEKMVAQNIRRRTS